MRPFTTPAGRPPLEFSIPATSLRSGQDAVAWGKFRDEVRWVEGCLNLWASEWRGLAMFPFPRQIFGHILRQQTLCAYNLYNMPVLGLVQARKSWRFPLA